MKTNLCLSLAGDTIESLLGRVSASRKLHADLIELRLDLIRRLDSSKISRIGEHLRGNEILTIRSEAEGGGYLSNSHRELFSHQIISEIAPSFVDIEIQTLRKFPKLLKDLDNSRSKLIASFHDLKGTKTQSNLRRIIADLFSFEGINDKLFAAKVVSTAKSAEDNLKVLGLYSDLNQERKNTRQSLEPSKLVAFCMGRDGIPSRILSPFLGSPITYVSLAGEPVATGQLDILTMRRILGVRASR